MFKTATILILITSFLISIRPVFAGNEPITEEIIYADFIYNNDPGFEQINSTSGLNDLLSYYRKVISAFGSLALIIDAKKDTYPRSSISKKFLSVTETFYSILGGSPEEYIQISKLLHSSLESHGKNNLSLCSGSFNSIYCATTGCLFCKNPDFNDIQSVFNNCWSNRLSWYCCNNCTS